MRPRVALGLYYFALLGALGFFWPFLSAHLSRLGMQPWEIGAISALYPLGTLVAPPLAGLFADLLRARVWLLRSLSAATVLSFAAFVQFGQTRPALIVAVALFSFFRAPLAPMADAAAVEHARRHGGSYGAVRLWGSVGFLVAALAGGQLLDRRGSHSVMLAALAALAAAAVAVWALPATPPRRERGALPAAGRLLAHGDFWLFLATVALGQLAHSAYDSFFSLHLARLGWGGGSIGLAWAVGVVAEIGLLAGSGRLIARFGAARLLAVAFGVGCLRWLLLAQVRDPGLILALQPLHAVTFAVYYVAGVTLAREQASAETQTAAQGLFAAAVALGGVLGMPLAGRLFERLGARAMFATAAVAAGMACACAVVWARRRRQEA
jgi:MFS transporter, PPP family, 3-phenylpropionic acid transporter